MPLFALRAPSARLSRLRAMEPLPVVVTTQVVTQEDPLAMESY